MRFLSLFKIGEVFLFLLLFLFTVKNTLVKEHKLNTPERGETWALSSSRLLGGRASGSGGEVGFSWVGSLDGQEAERVCGHRCWRLCVAVDVWKSSLSVSACGLLYCF